MGSFEYRDQRLYCEQVLLADIAAEFGTPCYVYSRHAIETAWQAYDQAFADHPHLVCYAVKANSNLAILDILARLGAGFDIVSVGELERVLKVGGAPDKIVFAGVGKRSDEMRRAVQVGIRCFNIESEAELEVLQQTAKQVGPGVARVAVRVNPDVDADTHPYISTGLKENKFGVAMHQARQVYRRAADMPNIDVIGVASHIGSQLLSTGPLLDAVDHLLVLIDDLKRDGIDIRQLDVGGGLGIRYGEEAPPATCDYVQGVLARVEGRGLELIMEPGRSISGPAGVLLTRVEYLKHTQAKSFAVVDAGMNDLLRPALYDAWHDIIPLRRRQGAPRTFDVVGPVCETGDFLAKDRPLDIRAGDLLAVGAAGAYGFSMSSQYNSRPRAAEVMVDGDQTHRVRRREELGDLWRGESLIPE